MGKGLPFQSLIRLPGQPAFYAPSRFLPDKRRRLFFSAADFALRDTTAFKVTKKLLQNTCHPHYATAPSTMIRSL